MHCGSANALLEYETIEGKHIHEILEHGKIISEIKKADEESTHNDDIESSEEKPWSQKRKNRPPRTRHRSNWCSRLSTSLYLELNLSFI